MEALAAELVVNGRRLVLNEAHQPRAERLKGLGSARAAVADVSTRVDVGNLPFAATEGSVRGLFETHGFRPLEVYLGFDRLTQRGKGFAFVSMASEDEALQAIGALNDTVVAGRPVAVRPAAPRAPQQN